MRLSLIALLLCVAFCTSVAQTAESIIAKHIALIGGEKALKKVTTITMTGEYDYGGQVFPFTSYSKAPDLYKFVVPLNDKYYAQAFDGKNGWKIDAFKNETQPKTLSGNSARAMANEADVELESPFINYKSKGHQAVLEGKDSVKGKACFKIKFTRKNGTLETYYFDTTSSELLRKDAISKNEEMQGAAMTTIYSDYKTVDGLRFPFTAISTSNGQPILTVTINQITINPAIKDDVFKTTR
jgi:outer membrane lipoprotein-sorting protein